MVVASRPGAADWKSRSDFRPMKLLVKYEPERFTTVEFLPFDLDWTHVAEVRDSENEGLLDDNDPSRRQKVRNSTVEVSSQAGNALAALPNENGQWTGPLV